MGIESKMEITEEVKEKTKHIIHSIRNRKGNGIGHDLKSSFLKGKKNEEI